MPAKRHPKGTRHEGFGILNPCGDMWTPQIFATAAEAHEYVNRFWQGYPEAKNFNYRVVWARQRTTFVREVSHG